MNRREMIEAAQRDEIFDMIIIGGGATGLGAAVDAASRGYKTVLFEQSDFAKGTSSRSTKLIHGGLRYLEQGNIKLVKEALHERGRLCKNAPHMVHHRSFLVPLYHYWEAPFYGIGLKVYDLLAGSLGIEKSKYLTKDQVIAQIPTIETHGLKGGVIYYDGQFDDARLAMTLAHTAADLGAFLVNYMKVIDLIKEDGLVKGVIVQDLETGTDIHIFGKVVINATGVFTDSVRYLDTPESALMITPSQGVHVVLPPEFLPSNHALLVPKTADGRVLFIVPWLNRILMGTTDTLKEFSELEPKALDEEIDFILEQGGKYLSKKPQREDILSVFAGLRPLVRQASKETKSISRDHSIVISPNQLISIAGGKWTTYRKMAEDVIDQAIITGNLKKIPCKTYELKLHGYMDSYSTLDPWSVYGTDQEIIKLIMEESPEYKEALSQALPYLAAEVIFATRYEMAIHIEDVLSRRTRALFLDAQAASDAAPFVARLMAKELGHGLKWCEAEVKNFRKLAQNYGLNSTKSLH